MRQTVGGAHRVLTPYLFSTLRMVGPLKRL